MSWGKRFGLGGRYSPFGHTAGPAPLVTEDDYTYMTPDDILEPPQPHYRSHSHSGGYAIPSSRNSTRLDNGKEPDVLIIKHKGITYPIPFPAFTIGEGALNVGELRRLAAKETGADHPRRVKLLYKGRELKDDGRACRDEGLKQNSELMCVVSEAAIFSNSLDESSESADEDEIVESGMGGPRVDVDGTLIGGAPRKRRNHRSGKKSRKSGSRDDSGTNTPRESSHHLASEGYTTAGAPRPPSPMPSSHASAEGSRTPIGKIEDIASTFRTKFVPQCVQYTMNPPNDSKAKEFEYKKLSETILSQILLKLDAVDTEGDQGARARRKELVSEVQAMLNKLDVVGKGL